MFVLVLVLVAVVRAWSLWLRRHMECATYFFVAEVRDVKPTASMLIFSMWYSSGTMTLSKRILTFQPLGTLKM